MLAILGAFVYFGAYMPYSIGSYAPPAAFFHQGEHVQLTGRLTYDDGSPAVGVSVRLFATDELLSEWVTADETGLFLSDGTFETGQLVTVEDEARVRLATVFVPYDVNDWKYHLGTLVVPRAVTAGLAPPDGAPQSNTEEVNDKK